MSKEIRTELMAGLSAGHTNEQILKQTTSLVTLFRASMCQKTKKGRAIWSFSDAQASPVGAKAPVLCDVCVMPLGSLCATADRSRGGHPQAPRGYVRKIWTCGSSLFFSLELGINIQNWSEIKASLRDARVNSSFEFSSSLWNILLGPTSRVESLLCALIPPCTPGKHRCVSEWRQ